MIKARPGSRSAALLPEIAVRAEQDLQRMTTLFQVANDASYTLFIFDSFDDLRAVTGARPPVAGFVNGPYAYFVAGDPALAHEMAHLVAREAIGPGASPFLSEAIAETVFEPTKMASFDVEMKYLLSENRLPSLAELSATSDLMAWSRDHPEVGLYHVGGSWLQFLFRTRGAEKVKRYYVLGDTVAAFGEPLATLEASWRRWLEELPIRPEAMAAMAAKFAGGEPTTAIANETYIFRAELPDSL